MEDEMKNKKVMERGVTETTASGLLIKSFRRWQNIKQETEWAPKVGNIHEQSNKAHKLSR